MMNYKLEIVLISNQVKNYWKTKEEQSTAIDGMSDTGFDSLNNWEEKGFTDDKSIVYNIKIYYVNDWWLINEYY